MNKTVAIYFNDHSVKSWSGFHVDIHYAGGFAIVTTMDDGKIAYPAHRIMNVTEKSE